MGSWKPIYHNRLGEAAGDTCIREAYNRVLIVEGTNSQLDKGGLVPIASGRGHGSAISIRQKGAVLWGGRLKGGETVRVPDAPFVHVFVARGGGVLEGAGALVAGDAVRLSKAGTRSVTADPGGAEVLIWETV